MMSPRNSSVSKFEFFPGFDRKKDFTTPAMDFWKGVGAAWSRDEEWLDWWRPRGAEVLHLKFGPAETDQSDSVRVAFPDVSAPAAIQHIVRVVGFSRALRGLWGHPDQAGEGHTIAVGTLSRSVEAELVTKMLARVADELGLNAPPAVLASQRVGAPLVPWDFGDTQGLQSKALSWPIPSDEGTPAAVDASAARPVFDFFPAFDGRELRDIPSVRYWRDVGLKWSRDPEWLQWWSPKAGEVLALELSPAIPKERDYLRVLPARTVRTGFGPDMGGDPPHLRSEIVPPSGWEPHVLKVVRVLCASNELRKAWGRSFFDEKPPAEVVRRGRRVEVNLVTRMVAEVGQDFGLGPAPTVP